MVKVNFDKHARTYRESLNTCFAPFGGKDTYYDSYKIECIKKWAVFDDKAYDILDYGCGIGKLTGLLAKEFRKSVVYGWDISRKSLRLAKEEYAETKNINFIDELFPDRKYDFIIVSMVFHHIKPDDRINTLINIKRLLKPDGKIIIFEHNPLNPVVRYIINRCPLDEDAELVMRNKFVRLAKICGLQAEFARYTLFFPRPSKLLMNLENLLKFIPFSAQYMLILSSK